MVEWIQSGGWMMVPILACSLVASIIILERLWTLRRARVLPGRLVKAIRHAAEGGKITEAAVGKQAMRSPLGRLVTVGILNRSRGRDLVKESIEDAGRHVAHELELFLNTLGTIAVITPLLGLLGTVLGMIEVFEVISNQGSGNSELLAGGIGTALITTAGGLTVAIPSLLFHRYFRGKVDSLIILMEQEAVRLVDILSRPRRSPSSTSP